MRLTFPYDWLLDQVLDGRKTASVLRPGEVNYGMDPRDGDVRVDGEYEACGPRGDVRCRIRVTELRELRWGDAIPERLWRAEACASEAEFRRDHVEWFSQPGPEYRFRAFWFERIAGVLLALACLLGTGATPARADGADEQSVNVRMMDAAGSAPTRPRPRLANEREVVGAIMRPMLETGLVAHGTVFADVRVEAAGGVTPRAFYGNVHSASPELARLVRHATSLARFVTDSDPGPQDWAIFWVLQDDACRPWTYDAPPRATVVRVCIDVEEGRANPGRSYYVVDALPTPRSPTAETVRFEQQRNIPYPSGPRRRGEHAELRVRLTVNDRGDIVASDVVENTGGREFARWAKEWTRVLRAELPPGSVPAGKTRAFDVGVAFQTVRPGARDCVFVLPDMVGLAAEVRICASRGTGR